jgi:hypothetical protein
MDYTSLLSKAWEIIKSNRFLVIFGMLVGLGSMGGGSSAGRSISVGTGEFTSSLPRLADLPPLWQSGGLPPNLTILAGIVLILTVGVWVFSTISRGGLIYGVDRANRGEDANFGDSFRAGWKSGWKLIGIGLVPIIPLFLMILIPFVCYQSRVFVQTGPGVVKVPNALGCLLVFGMLALLFLLLSCLKVFADRACMMEGLGVFGSYLKGSKVLSANLGAALVLLLLQMMVSIGFGILLFLSGIFFMLCCFLWPLIWVAQGGFTAFCSALWTLAWVQWTGVR